MLSEFQRNLLENNFDNIRAEIKKKLSSKEFYSLENKVDTALSYATDVTKTFDLDKMFSGYIAHMCILRVRDELRDLGKQNRQKKAVFQSMVDANPTKTEEEVLNMYNKDQKENLTSVPKFAENNAVASLDAKDYSLIDPSGLDGINQVDWEDSKEFIIKNAKKAFSKSVLVQSYIEHYVIPNAEGNSVTYEELSQQLNTPKGNIVYAIKSNEDRLSIFFNEMAEKCGMLELK